MHLPGPVRTVTAGLAGLALTLGLAPASPASAAPPAAPPSAAGPCPQLRLADRWYGDVGERLQEAIDQAGSCEGSGSDAPVAVFDWDNTMIKNDISDQTTFWVLRESLLRQPPRRDWSTTSRWITPAAVRALRDACGSLARPGRALPTGERRPQAVACADEILSMRLEQTTTGGRPGFAGGYDHRQMNAGYAWMAQLMAGRTPRRVRALAADARDAALRADRGDTWRVGSSRQIRWVRYYAEQRDLVATLEAAGITPWVVSASPQLWADVWAPGIGVPRSRTIGIRSVVEDGRVTTGLQGCGGYADGSDRIMTYVEGKRCWVNQEVLGIEGPAALDVAPAAVRPVIAVGDASTDVSMVSDATLAHVVLNRNSDEVMCRAYDDADGRWLVTPMFIEPLPRMPGRYPCSTEGAERSDGSFGPVRRPDGSVVPDQRDRVHP